jgi:hypothetical protein
MKCIALFLLFPLYSLGQNCNLKTERDPYTKELKISTGFIKLNPEAGNIRLSIEATSTEIDFLFVLQDGKQSLCFDKQSTATVFYDGTRLKSNIKNAGSMNCEGLFQFNFKNSESTPSLLKNLAERKLGSIKFTTTNKTEKEVLLTVEDQEAIMQLTTCLLNEAKGLIKKPL